MINARDMLFLSFIALGVVMIYLLAHPERLSGIAQTIITLFQ